MPDANMNHDAMPINREAQRYSSKLAVIGAAGEFPEFTGERVYMQPFYQKDGLPPALSRWGNLVSSMLHGVETDQPIYVMIDQKHVEAGQYHRRPGLHIDGYWGGSSWSHISAHGSSPAPSHRGSPPSFPAHRSSPSHRSEAPQRHRGDGGTSRHMAGGGWGSSTFAEKEAIILASNVTACRALEGEFYGPIGDMGDCADIDISGMTSTLMEAGMVYAGNVTMVHETLPCVADCFRTVVRLNVPGWSPEADAMLAERDK